MSHELTKAEEQVMHILWELQEAFVKDIVDKFPDPKPAYNTVSTIIRILEKKGVVSYHAFGRTHRYYPLISKEAYLKNTTESLVDRFFDGSARNLLSFFVKEKDISIKELEKIIHEIKQS